VTFPKSDVLPTEGRIDPHFVIPTEGLLGPSGGICGHAHERIDDRLTDPSFRFARSG